MLIFIIYLIPGKTQSDMLSKIPGSDSDYNIANIDHPKHVKVSFEIIL